MRNLTGSGLTVLRLLELPMQFEQENGQLLNLIRGQSLTSGRLILSSSPTRPYPTRRWLGPRRWLQKARLEYYVTMPSQVGPVCPGRQEPEQMWLSLHAEFAKKRCGCPIAGRTPSSVP